METFDHAVCTGMVGRGVNAFDSQERCDLGKE